MTCECEIMFYIIIGLIVLISIILAIFLAPLENERGGPW